MMVSGGLLLLLDQWSKRIVRRRLSARGLSWGAVLRLRCVQNRTSLFRGHRSRALLVLVWCAALVAMVVLHRSGAWFQSQVAMIGLGLALGGAAGNLLDGLRDRAIVDFIDLGWWPVFNVADVAIVAGLLTAFWQR
jgi:signal peptidase II